MHVPLPVILLAVILPLSSIAQTDSLKTTIPEKTIERINNKYERVNGDINKQTLKLLDNMQRKEASLQKKLQKIDSTKAARLFASSAATYQSLEQKLQAPVSPNITNPLKEYIPGFDSLQTAFKFLGQYGSQAQQLQGVTGQMQQLQGTLQQANAIQLFLNGRQQQLQNELGQLNVANQLAGMNKQLFYYQQQFKQYKELINDPEKLGETVLNAVLAMPSFQNYFQQNSYLSQLFGVPKGGGTQAVAAGLQTKAQVQQLVSQKTGGTGLSGAPGGGASGQSMMQQQMQGATQQLAQLQKNVASLGGGGGNSDAAMPDFKPNEEKTKTFLKRLEYGFGIQNTQATSLAPSMSTFIVTVGYKLSQKATIGVGASYILGLGRPVNDIQLSNEGAGLLSYVDIKAKGSFWVTGGMQSNYYQTFGKLSELYKNVSAWQTSALLGLEKKYKISNSKQGNIQLLYDFLYRQHIPVSQPLVFRMGFSF